MTEQYPNVQPWQLRICDEYGELITNTGGNEPADLLNRLRSENNLAVTNAPVSTLAVAVLAQVTLILSLETAGRLAGIRPGDLVERRGMDLDPREVVSIGRDFLTLDIMGKESDRLPLDNYTRTGPVATGTI